MYMLDTDICSYLIKKRSDSIERHFRRVDPLDICISVITEAELLYGLALVPERKDFAHLVRGFLDHVSVEEWNRDAAAHYANVRMQLEGKGKTIANMDFLIAAHALSLGATMVTNNTRHFAHIPKLKVVNWA